MFDPLLRCLSTISVFTDVRWVSSLRDSNLVAVPLLFDTDGDGYKDIIVPSFSGEVWAVHGENGHIVDNWPFYLEERAFYASPLVVSSSTHETLGSMRTARSRLV